MSGTEQARIKIGTGEFGGRVVSGAITETDPSSILLRQLYPHPPVDIGVIDAADTEPALTLIPAQRRSWTEPDRAALTAFFTARLDKHSRLTALLDIAGGRVAES